MTNILRAAIALHKTLLDAARLEYERVHGRIAAPAELLRLVTRDPWFAWLRPLSQHIVALDDACQTLELSPADAVAVRRELEAVLGAPDFAPRYLELLQTTPDVVLAHAHLQRQLA